MNVLIFFFFPVPCFFQMTLPPQTEYLQNWTHGSTCTARFSSFGFLDRICAHVWEYVCVCVFQFVISKVRVISITASLWILVRVKRISKIWSQVKLCSQEVFSHIFSRCNPSFQTYAHTHTLFFHQVTTVHPSLYCLQAPWLWSLNLLCLSLLWIFWCTQLANGKGMSSFHLRQHEKWLCCRRLGEESVMRKHRGSLFFFFLVMEVPPHIHRPVLRIGFSLSSSQAWRDLSLQPPQVNSTRTDLWKCLTFPVRLLRALRPLSKPINQNAPFVSLCLSSNPPLSPSLFLCPCFLLPYHTFVHSSEN